MDFGALLHYAKKKNDAATKDEGKYYSTKYSPPKKESKESKQLSNNIQKFLKKREEEEADRKRQEREKLNSLLAMRDEKSKNKIRKMLKVTKSANKSVLEDAKDCDNTETIDQTEGDGDDYGYTSTEANAFYQKYIEKVKDVQEDKGFAPSRPHSVRDLSGTKERVKAAITREREEAKTHTRHRSCMPSLNREPTVFRAYATSSSSSSSKTLYNPEAEKLEEERKKEEQKKAKPKRPQAPPPMDFQALLRLAEKKQHEPVNFVPEKKKEPERLLSAREKREQEERQRWKEQRAQRDRMRETEAKSKDQRKENSASQQRLETIGRIPKLNKIPPAKPSAIETKAKTTSDSHKRPASTAPSSSSAKISALSKPPVNSTNGSGSGGGSGVAAAAGANANKRSVGNTVTKSSGAAAAAASASSAKVANSGSAQSRNPYAQAVKTGATREFPPREPAKTRAFPPNDVQRAPPRKPTAPEARGRAAPPGRKQPEPANKRRIYEPDDSEYDSELDDFIDDGDCGEDISSHIRDIFGYDKRKYRDIDEGDDRMESTYAQMQREEFISKKIGLEEDLEDMRMEALLKKRKMAKKRSTRIDDDD